MTCSPSGIALFKHGYDWIYPNNTCDISFSHLMLFNLDRFLDNLNGFIVSVWFLFQPKKLENKFFWILAGLLFGSIALILFLVLQLIQGISSKTDYQKPIKSILILTICILLLKPIFNLGIERYVQNMNGVENSGFIITYGYYLDFFQVAIMSPFNIWLGLKVFGLAKGFGKKPFVWCFSTFFLGIIPLILLNLIEMIDPKK